MKPNERFGEDEVSTYIERSQAMTTNPNISALCKCSCRRKCKKEQVISLIKPNRDRNHMNLSTTIIKTFKVTKLLQYDDDIPPYIPSQLGE